MEGKVLNWFKGCLSIFVNGAHTVTLPSLQSLSGLWSQASVIDLKTLLVHFLEKCGFLLLEEVGFSVGVYQQSAVAVF